MRTVPIHTWGGFGSQLFALALHVDLLRKRDVKSHLVCHTSGSTERRAELSEYCSSVPIVQIYDFKENELRTISSTSGSKKAMRSFVGRTGIVSMCNTDNEFAKVNRFVQQFRGHYSLRTIGRQTILDMNEILTHKNTFLNFANNQEPSMNTLSIHYRLGDLISLKEKTFVSPERITSAIEKVMEKEKPVSLRLSSDSPLQALEFLNLENKERFECSILNGNSLDVISKLQSSKSFIGTNSKLSLWIILLRLHFSDKKTNWIPIEMRNHLLANVENPILLERINFY